MADEESKPKVSAEKQEPTYHVDRLIAESEAFLGVAGHVAAGAFSGQSRKTFTRGDATKVVKDWLRKPVVTDERKVA